MQTTTTNTFNLNLHINSFLKVLSKIDQNKVLLLADQIKKTVNTNTTFIIGNGGSSAIATHFAGDLLKNCIPKTLIDDLNFKRIKSLCLNDNVPVMTALSNDLSYDAVFSEQLKSLAKPNDLLITVSSSGNSKNIIKAIETAKLLKLTTFSLVGFDGGTSKKISDDFIHINSNVYSIVEDSHMFVLHAVIEVLKDFYQNNSS